MLALFRRQIRATKNPASPPGFEISKSLERDQAARLGNVKLVPGMPVDAFVQTGERTVLSYLMKPLSDQVVRAFREK